MRAAPAPGACGLGHRAVRHRAAAADAQGDELHRRRPRTRRCSGRRRRRRRRRGSPGMARSSSGPGGQRHADLVQLAEQAHVGRAFGHDVRGGDPGASRRARPSRVRARRAPRRSRQRRRPRPGGSGWLRTCSKRQRRGQEAEGGGGAGGGRDQQLRHAQRAGDAGRVRRAGAAEADHRVAARVAALLDDVDAGGGGHALGHDPVDAPGRLDRRQAERLADARQRAVRGVGRSSAMRPPRKKPGRSSPAAGWRR